MLANNVALNLRGPAPNRGRESIEVRAVPPAAVNRIWLVHIIGAPRALQRQRILIYLAGKFRLGQLIHQRQARRVIPDQRANLRALPVQTSFFSMLLERGCALLHHRLCCLPALSVLVLKYSTAWKTDFQDAMW